MDKMANWCIGVGSLWPWFDYFVLEKYNDLVQLVALWNIMQERTQFDYFVLEKFNDLVQLVAVRKIM